MQAVAETKVNEYESAMAFHESRITHINRQKLVLKREMDRLKKEEKEIQAEILELMERKEIEDSMPLLKIMVGGE